MRRILVLAVTVVVSAVALALPALAADGPVKLEAGNKVAPIWAFTNGDDGQRNIIDTVPGRKDYTPLWAVRMVTWRNGANVRVLRSAAAVSRARRAGDLTIRAMPVVVNCPVL